MNFKILSIIMIIAFASAQNAPKAKLDDEYCHFVKVTEQVPTIVKQEFSIQEPYIISREKYVSQEVCKSKVVSFKVKVPSIKFITVKKNQKRLLKRPYRVKVPYLTTQVKTTKQWFRKSVVGKAKVPTISYVKRSIDTYREVPYSAECTKYRIVKVKKFYKKPYYGVCNKGGKNSKCVKFMELPYTERKAVSYKSQCKRVKCEKHVKTYHQKVVKYVERPVKKFKFYQKDVQEKELVVKYKDSIVYRTVPQVVPTEKRVRVVSYTVKNVKKNVGQVQKEDVLEKEQVLLYRKKTVDRYKVEVKSVTRKQKVCPPPTKRRCVVWGDPHYEAAYGQNYTSRDVVGDTLIAKSKRIEVHGRVAQWELDATVVSDVAFRLAGCDSRFFVRGKGLQIDDQDATVEDFNDAIAKCDAEISSRIKDEYITEYKLKVGGGLETLKILVGTVKGEVEWKQFTEEELKVRKQRGLSKYWMEVAIVGFIKPVGACFGEGEVQASGIFYNPEIITKLNIKVSKKKCAEGHYKQAQAYCKKEFETPFTINACIFDQCHKMSMLAEVAFKEAAQKAKFEQKLYNARLAKNYSLVKELLRQRAELRKKLQAEGEIDVEKFTWHKEQQ